MRKKPLSFYMTTTGLLGVYLLILQAAATVNLGVFYGLTVVLALCTLFTAYRLKSDFFDFFKSLKLAAAVLVYLTIAVIVGTLILQNVEEARYLQHYSAGFYKIIRLFRLNDTYHSVWFIGLVTLLNLNILVCTLDKLPLRKKRIGFFLIHLSILLVVIGGTISAVFGIKGYIHMNEGQVYDSFHLTRYSQMLKETRDMGFQLRLDKFEVDYYPDDYRVYAYYRDNPGGKFGRPYSFKAIPGKSYKVSDAGGSINILKFFHDYGLRDIAKPAESGVPAAEVMLQMKERSMTAYFFDMPGDDRFFLPNREGMVIFRGTQPKAPRDAVRETMLLTLTSPDGSTRKERVHPGETFRLTDTATATVGRFIPSFTLDNTTGKIVSKGNDPDNPALELIIRDQNTTQPITHWVFANFPEFSHGKKLPGDVQIAFTYIPGLTDKPVYIVSPDSRVTVVEKGRVTRRFELENGVLPLEGYRIEFKRFIPKAEKVREELDRSDQYHNPVVRVEWNKNGQTETYTFSSKDKQATFLENGRLALLLRNKEDTPKAYRSYITVLQNGKEVLKKKVEVNHPLVFGGYYFYQSNYDPKDPTYSGISVVRDPGVYIVFLGFFLLTLGGILRFYFKM